MRCPLRWPMRWPLRWPMRWPLRWPLRWGEQTVSARFAVSNLFNQRGFELRGSGAYAERPGRQASLSLSTTL